MMETISNCHKCDLCFNQLPLIDTSVKADIMLIGLSAKIKKSRDEVPFDERTRSGKLVNQMDIIAKKYGRCVYKTNIVKCPPIGDDGKLRYPNKEEIDNCFENLLKEINLVKPRIVFLFGKIVIDTICNKLIERQKLEVNAGFEYYRFDGKIFVKSYHPSYILRSSKRVEEYIRNYEQFVFLMENIENE